MDSTTTETTFAGLDLLQQCENCAGNGCPSCNRIGRRLPAPENFDPFHPADTIQLLRWARESFRQSAISATRRQMDAIEAPEPRIMDARGAAGSAVAFTDAAISIGEIMDLVIESAGRFLDLQALQADDRPPLSYDGLQAIGSRLAAGLGMVTR